MRQSIHLISLMALAGTLLGCNTPASPATPPTPALALTDCRLSAPGTVSRINAKCGQFMVPEDRANPAGRTLTLNLAVVPAVSRSPEADSLFFLTGGPGQAATESYVTLAGAFESIRQKRDIVLVDQRGTGQSHPLQCQESAEAVVELDEAAAQAQQLADLQTCLTQLDADPRFYTTAIAMQDLDEVRAALGYAKINLYGVSYGTRAALTYLQMFPDRVRTVVLDGVVPQDEALGGDVASDAQRALDLIFTRCETDAGCQVAFPAVRTEFDTLLTQLEKEPRQVTLPHPATGAREDVRLTRTSVALTVRLLSYTPETAALLPLLIHTAAQGDYAPLAAQSLIVIGNLERTISAGMAYSVECAEDVPFLTEAQAEASRATYYGDWQLDKLRQLCAIWPHTPAPAAFKQPVSANVPVLLLSGEADPVTPPENAAQVARTLPNSLQLVAPGQGHNVIYRGCLPRVAAEFVKAGTTQGLKTDCVQTIQASPFFLSFTGPQP